MNVYPNTAELQFVSYYSSSIKSTALLLDPLSTFSNAELATIIAGCVAEELHDRNESLRDVLVNRYVDSAMSRTTNQELLESYSAVKSNSLLYWTLNLLPGGEIPARLEYPTLYDVGAGNIQLQTAMRLLEAYNLANPTADPLGIKLYNENPKLLTTALLDRASPTTAKFAGLMIVEGEQWFTKNTTNWSTMTTDQKSGLLVYYYNVGKEFQDAKVTNNGGQPIPADVGGTPIAQEFIQNKASITSALASPTTAPGSAYVGPVPLVIVATEGADNIVASASNQVIDFKGGDDVFGVPANLGGASVSVLGGLGNDIIMTARGLDLLAGGGGADFLAGGAGADTIRGESGDDVIFIAAGEDHVDAFFSSGDEVIDGGLGVDVIRFWGLTDGETLTLNDKTVGIERIELGNSMGDRRFALDRNVDASYLTTVGLSISGNDGKNKIIGTGAADVINGDAGNDLLVGGAGADAIHGGTGNDILDGHTNNGTEKDTLYGGDGADDYYMTSGVSAIDSSLDGKPDRYFLSWSSGTTQINDAGNWTSSWAWGAVPATPLTTARLASEAPPDTVSDLVHAGLATDLNMTELGSFSIAGKTETGDDAGLIIGDFNFADGDIHLDVGREGTGTWGTAAADKMEGKSRADLMIGGEGNDRMDGKSGDDELSGEDGNDKLEGGSGNDSLYGDRGDDKLDGGSGRDSMWGGSDNDTLYGGSGDDMVSGNQGDDRLNGESGNDRLLGGGGADWLAGGSGDDTFVFAKDFGTDTIADFNWRDDGRSDRSGSQHYDRIEVSGLSVMTFDDMLTHATETGDGVTIDFGTGDILTLMNTNMANLHADAFLFVA